jgi:hypothetical protein
MRIRPQNVPHLASQLVLRLVLDRDVTIAPAHLGSVERDVAMAMRPALRQENRVERSRRAALLGGYARPLPSKPGTRHGMVRVAAAIIADLRRNPVVDICSDDAALLHKIRSVFARIARHAKKRSAHSGDVAPQCPGAGSAGAGPGGGSPAEARVSEEPPRPWPPVEDLDRRGRRRRN